MATTALLAGCGPAWSGSATPSVGGWAAATPSPPAQPTDAADLETVLTSSTSHIRSAHVDIILHFPGLSIMGSGDETALSGRVRTLDLTATDSDLGPLRVVVAGGHPYINVATAVSHAPKPWVLADPYSSQPEIQDLATTMSLLQEGAHLDQFSNVSDGATLRAHEQDTLATGPTTHYSLSVDVHEVTGDLQQELVNDGVTTFPVGVWLDQENRLVKFTQDFPFHGQEISLVVTIGNFDVPVTITPPPADQVFTG